MEAIIEYIQANVHLAPWMIFFLLLGAGFNLPISEDVMLFISALLAKQHPEYLKALFVGVYLGAYFSDLIAYGLGRGLGLKILQSRFFSKMVSQDRIGQVSQYYGAYGPLTLLVGRFIPFGVRNALFITAGIGKMKFWRFALFDWVACTISCSAFFWLYYTFGESVVEIVKQGNMVLFGGFITILVIFAIKRSKSRS